MPRLPHSLLLALFGASVWASGCAGGGALVASVQAPPVEISGDDAMKELRFRAEARTSAPVLDGLVRVVVRPEARSSSDGQMRVTVYRGPDAVADSAPTDDVVPCAAEAPVEVPREALAGCEGSCTERFVVVFAAENLEDTPVAFPIVLEAELFYEYAEQAPEGDFLRLTLE